MRKSIFSSLKDWIAEEGQFLLVDWMTVFAAEVPAIEQVISDVPWKGVCDILDIFLDSSSAPQAFYSLETRHKRISNIRGMVRHSGMSMCTEWRPTLVTLTVNIPINWPKTYNLSKSRYADSSILLTGEGVSVSQSIYWLAEKVGSFWEWSDDTFDHTVSLHLETPWWFISKPGPCCLQYSSSILLQRFRVSLEPKIARLDIQSLSVSCADLPGKIIFLAIFTFERLQIFVLTISVGKR